MPTNRTRIGRPRGPRITPEVAAAWMAADYRALHCALRWPPWQPSALPVEITALGVSADDPPNPNADALNKQCYTRALKLQRELMATVGWPDCREVYQENLREAESWRDYCRELVEHPEFGGQGTGCDPASRAQKLRDAEDRVAYRQQLLDELDEK